MTLFGAYGAYGGKMYPRIHAHLEMINGLISDRMLHISENILIFGILLLSRGSREFLEPYFIIQILQLGDF